MDTQLVQSPPSYEEEKINKLIALREEYMSCQKCPKLCETRKAPVFGIGNPNADIIVIAEAPGKNEDERGVPLIGESGKLLDFFLASSLGRRDANLKKLAKGFKYGKNQFGKSMYIWPQQEEVKQILCNYIFYTKLEDYSSISCMH